MAIDLEKIKAWDGQSGTGMDARRVIDDNFEKVKTGLETTDENIKTGLESVDQKIVQLAGEGINNMMLGLNYSLSGTPVYENDTIKSSDIIWANNDVGRLTFSDYDENEACFTSFQATNTNRSLKVLQPSVTYNPNGEIQNYPALTIEKY